MSLVTNEHADRVRQTLARRVPFPDEPFHPRSVVARVYATPKSWFGSKRLLHPVAFDISCVMFEMFGVISTHGGTRPYLFVTDQDELVVHDTSTDRSRYRFVTDFSEVTADDLERLAIGIRGDKSLLDREYEAVHQKQLELLMGDSEL